MSRSRADDGSCSCSPPGTSWPAAWIGRGVRAIAVRRCHLRDGVRRRRATDVRAWRGSACPLRGRRAGPAEPVSIPPLPARRWIPRCGRCCRGYSWPGNPVRAAQAVDIAALGGRHAARQLAGFLHSAADALPGREAGVRVTADLRCCGSRPTPSPCPVGCRPADVSCCARQCTPAAPLEVRQDWRLLQRDRTVLLPGRGLGLDQPGRSGRRPCARRRGIRGGDSVPGPGRTHHCQRCGRGGLRTSPPALAWCRGSADRRAGCRGRRLLTERGRD